MSSGAFALHAIFALMVSVLIAFDIVAAAASMTKLDVAAPDTDIVWSEP